MFQFIELFLVILQVRPKRISGHSTNFRAKVPRLLTAHKEARPRFSTAVACSPEIQSLVASLRKSWRQSHSIDDVLRNHPRALSPFDITCVLTELQRQHDWQCTLEVICSSHLYLGQRLASLKLLADILV